MDFTSPIFPLILIALLAVALKSVGSTTIATALACTFAFLFVCITNDAFRPLFGLVIFILIGEFISYAVSKKEQQRLSQRFPGTLSISVRTPKLTFDLVVYYKTNQIVVAEVGNGEKIKTALQDRFLKYDGPLTFRSIRETAIAFLDVLLSDLGATDIEIHFKTHPIIFTTDEPPETDGVRIGQSTNIRYEDRVRDVYVCGRKRTGKSTVLLNIVCQDIAYGKGVGVIDPHGDLAKQVIARVPKSRVKDVLLFYPDKYPIALNPLTASTNKERERVAEDIVLTLSRTSINEQWGVGMDAVLRMTCHALLSTKYEPRPTFMDIDLFLSDGEYRGKVLESITNDRITNYWTKQFGGDEKKSASAIAKRFSRFVMNDTMQRILGDPNGKINLNDIMDSGTIFVADLSGMHQEIADLLGTFLISQIQLAVFRRAEIPEDSRRPFYLAIDEFQRFETSAFNVLLNETGKFKLHLLLSNQFPSDLKPEMKTAIGNIGNIVTLSLPPDDAKVIGPQLGPFDAKDIMALDANKHEAIYRPPNPKDTILITTRPNPPVQADYTDEILKNAEKLVSSCKKPPEGNNKGMNWEDVKDSQSTA